MSEPPISEAFDLIRQYAVREGWIPIGYREWTVGPWRIRVNGTSALCEGVPPWQALVAHQDILAILVLNPFGGGVAGWRDAEDMFIAAMRAELNQGAV